MIEENTDNEMLLCEENFPSYYVNKAHPTDYIIYDNPVRELIFHKNSSYSRLLVRASFKLNNKYIPITFICDTGAPKFLYLNKKSKKLLQNRINTDCLQNEYMIVNINNRNVRIGVSEPPTIHSEVNIFGLLLLELLGFTLNMNTFNLVNLGSFL